MQIQINKKDLTECTADDFEVLIHNADYRENLYIDYKKTFAFLEVSKEKVQKEIYEFRNDVCSFANADGGYIIYGVSEDKHAVAERLVGIEIMNTDRFELDLRNKLTPISPRVPKIKFSFINLEANRYLVVLKIEHDFYAPYLHLVDQKDYKAYKRDGNKKRIMEYVELRNMFLQSNILENKIEDFRHNRIEYYKGFNDERHKRFMICHIIPETFLDEKKQLFMLEKYEGKYFKAVFSGTKIDSLSIPCVDGLRYVSTYGDEEARLYNNGIMEYFLPLGGYMSEINHPKVYGLLLCNSDAWQFVDCVVQGYQSIMPEIFGNQRYFGCISIIGCKDVVSEYNYPDLLTKIDRNDILCQPVVFDNMYEKDLFCHDFKRLHLEYYLCLGIRRNKNMTALMDEIIKGYL